MNTGTTVTLLTVSGAVTLAGSSTSPALPPTWRASHWDRQLDHGPDRTSPRSPSVDGSSRLRLRSSRPDRRRLPRHHPEPDRHGLGGRRRPAPARAGTVTWQHTVGPTANDRLLIVGVSTGEQLRQRPPHLGDLRWHALIARGGDNAERRRTRSTRCLRHRAERTRSTSPSPRGSSCFVVRARLVHRGQPGERDRTVVRDTETGNTALLGTSTVPVQRGTKCSPSSPRTPRPRRPPSSRG